jgi:N-sulfoglucosamine sulfohydrolase
MQERSACDGRWKLIYREKLTPPWRQLQDDSKDWNPWGNRTYAETLRVKDQYPEAFRVLAEMDPQSLGGKVPALELYDLKSDPDEMCNLAADPGHRTELERLYSAMLVWVKNTQDASVNPPASATKNLSQPSTCPLPP